MNGTGTAYFFKVCLKQRSKFLGDFRHATCFRTNRPQFFMEDDAIETSELIIDFRLFVFFIEEHSVRKTGPNNFLVTARYIFKVLGIPVSYRHKIVFQRSFEIDREITLMLFHRCDQHFFRQIEIRFIKFPEESGRPFD